MQTPYLRLLEVGAPNNMECFFVAIYQNNVLIGNLLVQFIQLNHLDSVGNSQHNIKKKIRNFLSKHWASNVLFVGNNMITGQNSYCFSRSLEFDEVAFILDQVTQLIIKKLKSNNIIVHLVIHKDYYSECAVELKKHGFSKLYEFHAQPNMIFFNRDRFKSFDDYYQNLHKKYRDQFKRMQKKSLGVEAVELDLEDLQNYQVTIHRLYLNVVNQAKFNTFCLNEDHFYQFKQQCGNKFKIFGYFYNNQLIGFHSLLLNDKTMETYFLGYDIELLKEKMLYLNMLYQMTKYGIEHGYHRIIFGRTALEIKSSVGAIPVKMSSFVYHTNGLINQFLPFFFKQLEPNVEWQQRHPFKPIT